MLLIRIALLIFLPLSVVARVFEENEPQDSQLLFNEAQHALAAGNYAQAERPFRDLLKIAPRSAAAYSNLGVVYLRTNRIDSAIGAFKEAKRLAPRVLGIDLNLGLAYYKKQSFREALPYFERVLGKNPSNDQARYVKGMCHFMLDEYEATTQTLEPLRAKE